MSGANVASPSSANASAPDAALAALEEVFETFADPMLLADGQGVVRFANASARELLGSKDHPLVGHPLPLPGGPHLSGRVPVPDARGRTVDWTRVARSITWQGAEAWLVRLQPPAGNEAAAQHLRRVNQLYAALSQTTSSAARATDATDLFEDVCRIAIAFGGFQLAWIGRPTRDGSEVERVAAAGPKVDYLDHLRVRLDPETPEGRGPIGRALRLGVPYVCNDFAADPHTGPWKQAAASHGIASFAVFPLRSGGAISEFFAVYASEVGYFASDLLSLLNQMAVEISFGLERQLYREERRTAERALAESESRFRQIAAASRQVFWMRDAASGQMLYVSPACQVVLGRSQEELMASPSLWLDLVHPEDRAREEAAMAEGWKDTSGVRAFRIIRPDGAVRWLDIEVFPIQERGKLMRVTGVITDVTQRRRLLELLSDSQKVAKVGGWEYRVDEGRLTWTDETYRIHDLEPGVEIDEARALSFYAPGSKPLVEAAFRQGIANGTPWVLELQLTTAAGREIWVTTDGRAEMAEGRPWRLYGMIRDITQERAAATALREREERLREQAMLLDAANDAILVRDLEFRVEYWNRGAERLYGWTSEEAVGRLLTELLVTDNEAFDQAMRHVLETGAWYGEMEYRRRSGDKLLVEARWSLIRDDAGRPRAVLAINTDITERKRIESRFLRAQRLESIGTLAGGIAHDLNNILAPIILSADMLRTSIVDAGDLDLVDTIADSAKRGAEVVRQVLSFARGVESTRVPLVLRHLFTEFRKIVAETFPRNISFEAIAPNDLWSVLADPMQIHQVLLNLCLNAREAMPEGGLLRIEAANVDIDDTFAGLQPDARTGPHVRVRVSDTGRGIPEDIRDRIFDPFFTTKEFGRGSGLGLSTSLAIVRSHAGFISLESEVGRGTVFTIHLPAERAPTAINGPGPVADLPRGQGELVLVVDDEESVRSIIRQGLEGAGYSVAMADDGAEALSIFVQRSEEIALVLTDLMMPVMDGPATINALRRVSPDVKVIAMSGVSDTVNLAESTAPMGTLRFLLKPFTLESLLVAVHEGLHADSPFQP